MKIQSHVRRKLLFTDGKMEDTEVLSQHQRLKISLCFCFLLAGELERKEFFLKLKKKQSPFGSNLLLLKEQLNIVL